MLALFVFSGGPGGDDPHIGRIGADLRISMDDNGPMYRTLVDWEPRSAGKVNEYWDGFDRDQLVRLQGHEEFSALVTYATLPERLR